MILPIYLYGHPVLRKVAANIDNTYPELEKLIENMKETMYGSDGIGIAAPQVGVSAQLVYIDASCLADTFPELADSKMVLINPEVTVIEDGKSVSREEGCLSLPGIHENVTRIEKIHLKWQDENFEAHEKDIEGYLARVVQHECDHLAGKVFIDHISTIRKQLISGKLKKIVDGKVRCSYRTHGVKR